MSDNFNKIGCNFSVQEHNQLFLLQKTVNILQSKLQDSMFDAKERKEIQRIILDDEDDVSMLVSLPPPIIIKIEPNSLQSIQETTNDVPAPEIHQNIHGASSNEDKVYGKIPFTTDVS